MRWVRPLDAAVDDTVETLGAKAYGLAELQRLGLPVPAGFVVTTEACREFLRDGRLPDGLVAELATAIARLETASGRSFGGSSLPLTVSVRSGAAVSMPGMMDTVLNLGLTTEATAALANETGDPRFALRSRLRFVSSFAVAITNGDTDGSITNGPVAGDAEERPATAIDAIQEAVRLRCGQPIPDDASRQLTRAVTAVFASWDAPRARTYRELNDIPHRLGTAAIVQTMVFGNHDAHSGTGVAFSRDPNTGENVPFGDVLIGHQGEDVVDGRSLTRPLRELADREPAVWTGLRDALRRIEGRFRDACYVEFTFQSGELWLLQARPGRFVGAAAVRVATDLADEHVITRHEALLRVSPLQLKHVRTPRIAASDKADVIGTGVGACPGVAVGRVATTTDASVRMSTRGPVILVRPETSPHDMRGLAAAAGIATARGGPASHAAVVARAMGKPAVVGIAELAIDADSSVSLGGRSIAEGTVLTIDGTSGEVALGSPRIVTDTADANLHRLLEWADDVSGSGPDLDEPARLRAAQAKLQPN